MDRSDWQDETARAEAYAALDAGEVPRWEWGEDTFDESPEAHIAALIEGHIDSFETPTVLDTFNGQEYNIAVSVKLVPTNEQEAHEAERYEAGKLAAVIAAARAVTACLDPDEDWPEGMLEAVLGLEQVMGDTPTTNVQRVEDALLHLRAARDLLKAAGAPRAVKKARAALKSAEGAARHARADLVKLLAGDA
jgi:hypothetical protein